jgi:predicted O-methyltransferase YrrM
VGGLWESVSNSLEGWLPTCANAAFAEWTLNPLVLGSNPRGRTLAGRILDHGVGDRLRCLDVLPRRLTEIARPVFRRLRSAQTERTLRRSGEPTARAVADGLRAARRGTFDADALRWFERIEVLRSELATSDADVEVVDYGAGLPSMERSDEEMRAGFVSHSSVARLSTNASRPESQGRLLHAIVSAIRPTNGIELGTCVGLSAAYQATAMPAGVRRAFVTCEGAPELAAAAASNLRGLGIDWARVVPGRFDDTVPALAADLAPLHYAFIDGHHDEAATLRYFDVLRTHAAGGSVFVFDDIGWSAGMSRAWAKIAASPHVTASADLGRLGLVVLGQP